MRRNLVKDRVDSILFIGEFSVNLSDFRSEFDEYRETMGGDYPIVYVDIYSRSKVKHSIVLMLSMVGETENAAVQIQYDVRSALPTPPKAILRPENALDKIARLVKEIDYRTRTTFSYPSEFFNPSLPIPIKLGSNQISSYDEIWGMRLVKTSEDGQRMYSVIVDMPTEEEIDLTITMPIICKPQPSEIMTALDSIISISNLFMTSK